MAGGKHQHLSIPPASQSFPQALLDCGDLLSTAAGRDQSLRRNIQGTGSPSLPGDYHRQTHWGQEWALKGADPLRACLQSGAFHLSDLLHIESIICCPRGLCPRPIPIPSRFNVAVGVGCSSGKGSACVKNPFFAERCPQACWRCHLQDPFCFLKTLVIN